MKVETLKRQDIPARYGETYNVGNWLTGHVSLDDCVVAFVTLEGGTYHDQRDGMDGSRIVRWTSQNSTTPDSKKGREIISGKPFHFWTRPTKRANGGRFMFAGVYTYVRHTGSQPMTVDFKRIRNVK